MRQITAGLGWRLQPGIVSKMMASLDAIENAQLGPMTEHWDTAPVWGAVWDEQIKALGKNIIEAKSNLRKLTEAAQSAPLVSD